MPQRIPWLPKKLWPFLTAKSSLTSRDRFPPISRLAPNVTKSAMRSPFPHNHSCIGAFRSLQRTPCLKNASRRAQTRSEEHTSELQSRFDLVCRLLLEKKKKKNKKITCTITNKTQK